ncbi:MAG: hypothetical protein Q9213_006971 [Squamulea squamosa]
MIHFYGRWIEFLYLRQNGNGTNLQAIIDAIRDGSIQDAEIVRVVSNRAAAKGLIRAKEAKIPTLYHNLKKFGENNPIDQDKPELLRQNYDKVLADLILKDHPNLVIAVGWMHIVSEAFLDPLTKAGVPTINLHPALPGAYSGVNAIARAHQDFMQGLTTKTGVMVHYVIIEVDAGETLVVKELDIQPGESLEELEKRMHSLEWLAIVQGVQLAIEKLPISGTSTSNPI